MGVQIKLHRKGQSGLDLQENTAHGAPSCACMRACARGENRDVRRSKKENKKEEGDKISGISKSGGADNLFHRLTTVRKMKRSNLPLAVIVIILINSRSILSFNPGRLALT